MFEVEVEVVVGVQLETSSAIMTLRQTLAGFICVFVLISGSGCFAQRVSMRMFKPKERPLPGAGWHLSSELFR